MRSFRQSIAFIFVLALFAGSGPNEVCSFWCVAEIEHDHHEGQQALVLFEEADHCEQPSVPCNEANKELPDLQFVVPVDSQKQPSSPLIALVPAPAFEFGASLSGQRFEPLLFYESVRLSPVSRRVVFCCFLI